MDRPFDGGMWSPSRPWQPWENKYDSEDIAELVRLLNQETNTISHSPYDPDSWIRRGMTLTKLRYPELAAGDGHKAVMLARTLLAGFDRHPYRLGYRMGFWMEDPESTDSAQAEIEREAQEVYLASLQRAADKIITKNLHFWPERVEGRLVPRQYPWIKAEHTRRSDNILAVINREIAVATHDRVDEKFHAAPTESPCPFSAPCLVKRYAFGHGVGAQDGSELLGVFAARDISEGETTLVDTTRTWGCNGPGTDDMSSNLYGHLASVHEMHTDFEGVHADTDRWVRDRCGKKAADVILKLRFFLAAIIDCADHPLDHSLVARLTPTYREKFEPFNLEDDIVVINDALQQFGVDVFSDLRYDTWVYFVLQARVDNNCCSDPNTAAVHSLFSLFNHSCESNVKWYRRDHRTMDMVASRDIKQGEQLLVCYDGFMEDKDLAERRKRFRRWLNGNCQCTRCTREEEAEAQNLLGGSFDSSVSGASGDWDTDETPWLPEDDMLHESVVIDDDD